MVMINQFCEVCKEGLEMKDLVAYIAKALVDKPEEVVVTEIEGQQIYLIELKVAKEDIPRSVAL